MLKLKKDFLLRCMNSSPLLSKNPIIKVKINSLLIQGNAQLVLRNYVKPNQKEKLNNTAGIYLFWEIFKKQLRKLANEWVMEVENFGTKGVWLLWRRVSKKLFRIEKLLKTIV